MIKYISLETIYLLLITIPSLFIFLRIERMYSFSKYKGLRYLSSAFLFLAIGFILRYVIMLLKISQGSTQTIQTFNLLTISMEFFLITAGLLITYSMIWKQFEQNKYTKNKAQFIVYFIALMIALVDYALQGFYMMYASQIILFLSASTMSIIKYKKQPNQFQQLYFIAMVLFLIVWMINLVAQIMINNIPALRFYNYIFTVSAIFVFLYLTLRLTREFR